MNEQNTTQDVLANAAGISRSVLEVFSIQQDISPLTLAKMEKAKRKKASGGKKETQHENDW